MNILPFRRPSPNAYETDAYRSVYPYLERVVDRLITGGYRVWFVANGARMAGTGKAIAHEIRAIKKVNQDQQTIIDPLRAGEEASDPGPIEYTQQTFREHLSTKWGNRVLYVENPAHNLAHQHGIHVTVYDERVNHGPKFRRIQVGPTDDVFEWDPETRQDTGKQGKRVASAKGDRETADFGAVTFLNTTMFGPAADGAAAREVARFLQTLFFESAKARIGIRVVDRHRNSDPDSITISKSYTDEDVDYQSLEDTLKSLLGRDRLTPLIIYYNNNDTFDRNSPNILVGRDYKLDVDKFVDKVLNPRTADVLKGWVKSFSGTAKTYYLPVYPQYLLSQSFEERQGEIVVVEREMARKYQLNGDERRALGMYSKTHRVHVPNRKV
jgi:hypothetical protein